MVSYPIIIRKYIFIYPLILGFAMGKINSIFMKIISDINSTEYNIIWHYQREKYILYIKNYADYIYKYI